MTASSPDPADSAAVAAAEVQEILRSPPSTSQPLIADEHVSAGSYRRPSSGSPTEPFQSVTACSPLSSPEEEKAKAAAALGVDARRGGRRSMLRSGTSGSITPLSAAPSPNSEAGATRANSASSSSNGGLGVASGSASSYFDQGSSSITADMTSKHLDAETAQQTHAPTSHTVQRPSVLQQRPSTLSRRGTDTASRTTDGLLSVFATPAAEGLFRSPSQMSASSETDGYFTARPGSPADPADVPFSSTMLKGHSQAKSRTALRRERVSFSGRSYATAVDYSDTDDHLAAITATSLTTAGDDEACFVDGEHLSPNAMNDDEKTGSKRIDLLSQLPPELSLCIIFLLDDHKDLLSASAVSKRWRALAMDQSIWRHLFFSKPGWAIREDAPLVLQHQAELQRIEARAKRTAAKEEAERLRRIQEQRKAASTSSPYMDRLAALKSWRETLHIPSFPHLAGLSLGAAGVNSTGAGNGGAGEVDVDTGRPANSSTMGAPPMSPLRSPTAATGRFGLFLSPARPAPSTPAGARRAQEAASSSSSYFASTHDYSQSMSRQASTTSTAAGADYFYTPGPSSRRDSITSQFAEAIEAEEEFFAASLNWTNLYRDRFILEQRWMRSVAAKKSESQRGDGEMSRSASSASDAATGVNTSSTALVAMRTSRSQQQSAEQKKLLFEPTKRFLRGHQDSVYCIRQDDGVGTGTAGKIVSGSRDRTIRVWDVETGACKHILKGHTASVLSLQYDDQILVSVSSDGQVFVWDFASILATSATSASDDEDGEAENGAIVHTKSDRLHCILREHTSAVLDVVFDENWIVTGSKDATVRVWRRSDVLSSSSSSTTPVAWRKFSHTGPVNAVDLQGSQVVSASGEGSMYLWDLESGEKVHKFSGHTKGLACIAFKGTTLVSGSNDQTIRVWDTVSGKCTHVLGEHHLLVRTVAFDPVRRMVVSGGYDRMIKLWKIDEEGANGATTSSPQAEAETSSSTPTQQADSEEEIQQPEAQAPTTPDGETPQTSESESKLILGRCLRDIRCHRARIFDVEFNTTRIVSASEDHLICITNFGGQGIDASLFA